MHADQERLNDPSGRAIGCVFRVINTLGAGFLEKVYENALAHERRKCGLAVAQQHRITVHYDGVIVGNHVVDLLVEEALLIELKAVEVLESAHAAQRINYLEGTGFRLCLLLNIGNAGLEIRRFAQGF